MDMRRARLYAQVAFVFDRDAAALRHEYEWPPVTPTEEELSEAVRLTDEADKIFEQASTLGFDGGTDAAFKEYGEVDEQCDDCWLVQDQAAVAEPG